MSELNSLTFKDFVIKHITKTYKEKEKRDLEKEVIKEIENRTHILAKTFFDICKLTALDIDYTCLKLLKTSETFPKLPLLIDDDNKLNSFISTYTQTLKQIAKSSNIKYNRFIKLCTGEYNNLYPHEVYGLAIAFGITPSSLFAYLYGDGERPLVGL